MALGDGVTWNEALPDNSVLAHQIDDYDRDLRVGIRSRMAIEHVFSSTSTSTGDAGMHKFITFQQQTGAPTITTALTQVGALYVGSSGSGYPLIHQHSDGTLVTLVNSAKNIPVIASGTLGSIAICSSANPNSLVALTGSVDGLVLLSHSNTAGVSWGQVSSGAIANGAVQLAGVSGVFGAWVSQSNNTVYQASTDGFVIAYNSAGATEVIGLTDGNNPPTTKRIGITSPGGGYPSGITMPVRKGDYWKVTGADVVYWLPLGS